MARQVIWTPEAELTFKLILDYLEGKWTKREIVAFIEATERVVDFIIEHPRMFRKTSMLNVHEALITSHNLLIYKVYPTRIDLLTFWDTRQHPRKRNTKRGSLGLLTSEMGFNNPDLP